LVVVIADITAGTVDTVDITRIITLRTITMVTILPMDMDIILTDMDIILTTTTHRHIIIDRMEDGAAIIIIIGVSSILRLGT
jgi:hypothetical protein